MIFVVGVPFTSMGRPEAAQVLRRYGSVQTFASEAAPADFFASSSDVEAVALATNLAFLASSQAATFFWQLPQQTPMSPASVETTTPSLTGMSLMGHFLLTVSAGTEAAKAAEIARAAISAVKRARMGVGWKGVLATGFAS